MKKNNRTFRQDCMLIRRGIKEFGNILPGQMVQIFVRGILCAVLPFIIAAVSAYMIDGLLGQADYTKILFTCFIGLGITFLLSVWKAKKDSRIEVGYQRLFSCHEIVLTDKAYRLRYEELEKGSTRSLRDEVTGSIHISGAGMASLYWDMNVLFRNSATVVISVILFFGYLYMLVRWDIRQNSGVANTVFFILVILLLMMVCSYITCKTSSKRFDVNFEVFQQGSKYISFGDFYTREYLLDENAALDARIYEPDDLILAECQEKCYEHFAKGKEKEMHAVNLYDGIKFMSSCICGCIIYLLAGKMAMQGAIGTGSILLMYATVTMVIEALSQIAQIITDLRNNNEHLIKFFQYMDMPETASQMADDCELTLEELEVKNVSFRYPESDNYVLKNVNLKLHAGEKLAIVGENGSGKTTLIKLVCRLYQPSEGEILLNGRDITGIPFEKYIACIATVFQDFSLFSFSLGENVAASRDYDVTKVEEALKKARLEEKLLQLKNGARQPIFSDFDENGTGLSGGEQQKVAIARAVYKDAGLMVLDEPTAALDPYAEYEIYQNFSEITESKTLISISHRLSSCRMCDRILVLDEGRVAQEGAHEELVKDLDGKYYALWNAQAQYYDNFEPNISNSIVG